MGDDVRTSDVQKGDDSIVQYVAARELAAAGAKAEADAVLADLADYNRYDCVSTRRLRNWLIDIARQKGVTPAPPEENRARAATCLVATVVGYGGGLPASSGGILTQTTPYAAECALLKA